MVHASYSEADDLINELDRPSKYNQNRKYPIAICFTIHSMLPANWENGRYIFSVGSWVRVRRSGGRLIQWIIRNNTI